MKYKLNNKFKTNLATSLLALTLVANNSNASEIKQQSCKGKGIYLQVLGSGGPELQDKRASSGYLIWKDGKAKVIIDAGSGSAANFGKSGAQMSDVDLILFSHYHTDHSADFATYIKSVFFEGRKKDLAVFGATGSELFPSTKEFLERYIGKKGVYPYLSRYLGDNASYKIISKSIKPTDKIDTQKYLKYKLKSINAEHGAVPSLAWSIIISGKKITFSGDNGGHSNNLIKLAKSSDFLIIHNAIPNHTTGFVRKLHMTPDRIGEIAKKSKVKRVLLSHFMQRTLKNMPETIDLIKQNYKSELLLANDLSCYKI